MKRILLIFASIVIALTACWIAVAEPDAKKMETAADADAFITALLGDHPEEMEGVWAFSPQMDAALTQLGGIAGLSKQLSAMGTPKTIMPAYEGKVQGFKAFLVPCVFPAVSADIILILQDGAVAGISTGVYTGGEKEEKAESELYDSIGLSLPVPSLGELPGILTLPKGSGPFPAVVLIHGSGSSDKDETIGSLKPFRDIAEGLAAQGIAVYRFDKRSYVFGSQLISDRQLTLMDESVEDAVNAVQLLARQEKIDPARIFVLGHSLGGNAVPAIARNLEEAPVKACGFIMMAASPRPLDVLIREQYDYLYSLLPEVTEKQQAEKDAVFADLDKLKKPEELAEDDMVMGVWSAYWKWLAAYDVLQVAKEIKKPVLLLQGEEDYQVTLTDFEIWKNSFNEKNSWKLILYPGLTHTFTAGMKTEGSSAYSRAEKVDAQVIQDIAVFINGQ